MTKQALAVPMRESTDFLPLRDRIQIALAIADEPILKSLLVNCTPPIALPHLIGNISTAVGIPLAEASKAVDGVIQFEEIRCVLVDSPADIDPALAERSHWDHTHREFAKLTRCESETHILGQTITLAQSLSVLAHAGFSPHQVDTIVNLPYGAWHKSWWYTLDANSSFTVPFLRLIRTLHYTDGTLTLQYKDFFSQDKPACFRSQIHRVLIEIKPDVHNFRKTLAKINHARAELGIEKALLICNSMSDLEARGFMSQGISIYAANEVVLLAKADCASCLTETCPMHGIENSPVMACRRFCLG